MPLTTHSSLSLRLKKDLPPTPPLPAVLQTLACRWLPLTYFEWCRARYGSRFTIYPIDKAPVVFLSDPQHIREVLTAPATVLHPGVGAAAIAPIVGPGSFMLSEEDEHLRRRKTIAPAFGQRATQAHAEMITKIVEREVASWPLNTPIHIHPYLRNVTLKIVLRIVFGEDEPELPALHTRVFDMLSITKSFAVTEPRLRSLPGWHQTWQRFVRARNEMDQLMLKVIRGRRNEPRRPGDVLDILLNARHPDGAPSPDRTVRDDIMSTVLAGHETTAATLAWAFQLLAHNPNVRERLIDELDNATDSAYLTATVQEVLRHRPVFLFAIPRAVAKPIEIGGWTYTPPTQLLACIYLVHHDPTHHQDPHTFRPERFLQTPPSPQAWLPWGGGRKRCPGHRLATL